MRVTEANGANSFARFGFCECRHECGPVLLTSLYIPYSLDLRLVNPRLSFFFTG